MHPPALAGAIELEGIEQALQVAESGHGLAIGRRPLVDDRLARGTLVAPFGAGDPTGAAYYLCRPADAAADRGGAPAGALAARAGARRDLNAFSSQPESNSLARPRASWRLRQSWPHGPNRGGKPDEPGRLLPRSPRARPLPPSTRR